MLHQTEEKQFEANAHLLVISLGCTITMPTVICAVVGCHNSTNRLNKWKRELCHVHGSMHGIGACICNPPFKLFPFPSKEMKLDEWKEWCRRLYRKDEKTQKNWTATKWDRICSLHFENGEPSPSSPYPSLYLGKVAEVKPRRRKLVRHEGGQYHQPRKNRKQSQERVEELTSVPSHAAQIS